MPYEIPGMVVINKRNILKTSISWYEIMTSKKPSLPGLTWTSQYGSVTFNPLGREFPDGGVNETGLFIQEMTLAETKFPEDSTRPKMFMMQWMQYQLDNYETVDQVLSNLSNIILDGWGWHFFVSDKMGNYAAIEFLDGKPKIYSGASMPFPVLCNGQYCEELKLLKEYNGFGGKGKIDPAAKNAPRFVQAAYMIKNYPKGSSAVDYGFKILEGLDRGGTQWSYIIDVNKGEIYFKTSLGKEIKHFNLHGLDFSCNTEVKLIDINSNFEGNVSERFVKYTLDLNKQFITDGINSVNRNGDFTRLVESNGNTLENLIQKMAIYPESTICQDEKSRKQ